MAVFGNVFAALFRKAQRAVDALNSHHAKSLHNWWITA
jgi:hypothetical protein